MKTYALYGFISALAGAFLTLILYFLGFHSDAAKLSAAAWIGGILGLGILITCIVLGIRAKRTERPATEKFGFGSSFGAGFMVSLVSTVLSTGFTYIYNAYINPAFTEIMLQDRLSKMENSGMAGDKLDKAEAMTRMMFNPIPQALYFLVAGIIFGAILSLILAGFFTRPASQPPRV
jgi:Protein of unknown function (DUF4199)